MNITYNTHNVNIPACASRQTKFLRHAFLYIILFGVEFNITIFGSITLKKIAFILALLYIVQNGIPRKIPIQKICILFSLETVVLFVYAICVQATHVKNTLIPGNSAYSVIQILFQWILFCFIPLMLTQIFLNIEEFLKIQLAVISTQVLVAIVSRFWFSFRMFVYYHFVVDNGGRLERGMIQGIRVGILGGSGASGSWTVFIGCIICAYYILKTRKMRYLFLYMVILFSMAFIGRTGLYMGVLLLLLLFFKVLPRSSSLSVKLICLAMIGAFLIAVYILFVPESYLKTRTINWVGELFLKGFGEDSTVRALIDMGIPPLTWETLWGTGIVTGTTASGITAVSDVGYIHTYMALGLVGAALYYFWAYSFFTYELLQIKDHSIKWIATIFLLIIALVELKEPFLRKTPNATVLVSLLLMQHKKEQQSLGEIYVKNKTIGFCHLSKL